ncbi:CRISPR-associated endoribonuclease Cas6 [Thermodesulfovibrio sp. 1176]|uniref:CRISPR-associated endoribonuclease Cas6 n=1 Tax=Thermodesulfovibrio sp. 1176 TaxID=3043424 RepID=UPI0024829234|nr:CRISPR-associated endoribonuclease Cas6 [Thermodesulfovibrio sp. 1176]MDI1471668.1 CRISPR-associated endoribonuclease Cas6 [Thermodesulfovibrio sp. 1176]
MRLGIIYKIPKLPILYRHRFISLIKEALGKSDFNYKKSLYPEEAVKRSKIAKPFCFSISMPKEKTIKKEKIVIDEGIEIEDIVFYFPENSYINFYISSFDYQFIVNLYNGLLEIKEFDFGNGISLKLNRIFMLNERRILTDEVIFKTNSPILIEDSKENPILPIDSDIEYFNEQFNAIHSRILKDIRGEGVKGELEFEPLKIRKQVVKHTLKGFREKTGKPYMMLTCFEGCFKLKGEPEDLKMLYQIGIGLRTGQGFGMVEVV